MVDNVLNHKDMVVKAYEHDGVEELRVFLTKNLSPHREHWYICHEEPHSYNYFSEKHKVVQDALLKDEQIVQILKNEQLAARIKTMQKIECLIKEQNSEEVESENE